MKPPLCRICDTRHYLRDPHVFPDDVPAPKPVRVVTPPSAPVVTPPVVTRQPSSVVTRGVGSTERGRQWLAANRAERNAYMRDYRKRQREASSSRAPITNEALAS